MAARMPTREIVRWTSRMNAGNPQTTLVAIHESVGITNAWDLALFCERRGVSYHDLADLTQLIHTVRFTDTAWHLRDANPRAVGLCLTTPTRGYSREEWLGPQRAKVEVAAWWVARSCTILGLPIRDLTPAQIRSAVRGNKADGGATTHNNYTLATGDGTHTDPRGFPMDMCIKWARDLVSPIAIQPQPEPLVKQRMNEMIVPFTRMANGTFRATIMAETGTTVAKESLITFGSTYGASTFVITPLADGKVVGEQKTFRIPNNGNNVYHVPVNTRLVTIEVSQVDNPDTTPAATLWPL